MSEEPAKMSADDMLKYVEDRNSDNNEGVGEFGGYANYYVEDGILTVKIQAWDGDWESDREPQLVVTERQWRVVPFEAQEPAAKP